MIVSANFVQAFNLVDTVFHKNQEVREKRREFLHIATEARGRDIKPAEVERMKDLVAEMLAKMGKELGYDIGVVVKKEPPAAARVDPPRSRN